MTKAFLKIYCNGCEHKKKWETKRLDRGSYCELYKCNLEIEPLTYEATRCFACRNHK